MKGAASLELTTALGAIIAAMCMSIAIRDAKWERKHWAGKL
jgi:hypothetical protein